MNKMWSKKKFFFMKQAMHQASIALEKKEIPVGAIVVHEDDIVGLGYNSPITRSDPTAHAEIIAIRKACQHLHNYRLTNCDMYVTLEPCTMCVGAIIHSRISNLYFAALEPKAGAIKSQNQLLSQSYFNHKVNVYSGLMEDESRQLLQNFFKEKRIIQKSKKEVIASVCKCLQFCSFQ